MHLVINQSTDRTEQVTTACIDKLYNLSKSNTLDGTSYLRGSINAASAYEDAVTFLNTMWGPDLIVTANTYYIRFANAEVLRVLLANNIGDDVGVTKDDAKTKVFGDIFKNNTTIVEFDEYKEFTTQKTNSTNVSFEGCTSLESIDLTGATKIPRFEGCTSITYFNGKNSEAGTLTLSGTTWFSSAAFRNVTTLQKIIIPGYLDTGANAFWGANVLEVYVDTLEHWLDCAFGVNGQPISNNTKLYINDVLLTDLVVPASINSLKDSLFRNYKQLLTITMHENVTVNVYTFEGCDNLTGIYIPTLTDWLSCTFNANPLRYAHNLYIGGQLVTSVTIPQGTNLKNKFWGSTSLTTVTLNSGITEIQESAFRDCTQLVSISIPSSLTSLGSWCFAGSGLSTMVLPDNITTLGNGCFSNITTLTSVTLSNNLTAIPEDCFEYCRNLSSITIPQSVTSIGKEAFQVCTSLQSLDLPGVVSIDVEAFIHSGITTLNIGPSFTTVARESSARKAFANMSSLTTFKIEATTPPTLTAKPFPNSSGLQHIYVPFGSVNAYKAATGWSEWEGIIEAIPTT